MWSSEGPGSQSDYVWFGAVGAKGSLRGGHENTA